MAPKSNAEITIYAPMIYTAPCIMFWMRADTLLGQVGGGWVLEIESFLGPVKWHRADRRVPFGAQKTRGVEGLKPICECDGGVGWQCCKKILLGRKVFLPHCNVPLIILTHRFRPLHSFYSPSPTRPPHFSPSNSLPTFPPPPHPKLIRNQQLSVRCIKGPLRFIKQTINFNVFLYFFKVMPLFCIHFLSYKRHINVFKHSFINILHFFTDVS
jgi:hypothetical protein